MTTVNGEEWIINFLHMWMEKMQGRWNMIIHAAQKNVVL